MNTKIKWLVFGAYTLICSYMLYFQNLDAPFFTYVKILFPICWIIICYVLNQKDNDWDIIFDKPAKFIGQAIVFASLPALFFTIAIFFFSPYWFIGRFFYKLGVPTSWNFYLTMITPIILILISGSIYKKIKG
jgi:hypothetical protein